MSAQVLFVDDEPGVREAVQAYLEESDFTVTVASNAEDAWSKIEETPPDLVISDIMMPEVDGYQFLQQLREDSRFQSIPVVFLTAKGLTSDRISGYEAGCDVYLPKPFDPAELEAIVKSLLSRRAGQNNDSKMILLVSELQEIIQRFESDQLPVKPDKVNSEAAEQLQLNLTSREQEVLDLVVEGLMNKEIAKRLNVGIRNVEKFVSILRDKTDTKTRTELVRVALEQGLINK